MGLAVAEEHLEKPAAGNLANDQRRFVVLIDYSNLETGLRSAGIGFDKFEKILLPILSFGKVTFGCVFVPHLTNMKLPIIQMSNLFNFRIVQCPLEFTNRGVSKDKDTVDAVMIDEGISHIYHSDCTDIIIISGDGDFGRLAVRAMREGKEVHMISTSQALSGDFRKLESPRIKVHIIEK